METSTYFTDRFVRLQSEAGDGLLSRVRRQAFDVFQREGIPTMRHEEWKYTRLAPIFNKDYQYTIAAPAPALSQADFQALRLPGGDAANELVFVNGIYAAQLSTVRSAALVVLPLGEAAAGDYRETVAQHLGHSGKYLRDGINALNTAFVQGGVFVHVKKGKTLEHSVYLYHIADARQEAVLAQPRSLVHVGAGAQAAFIATYATLGGADSFTNEVTEIIVEQDAHVSLYKIQNDTAAASQVSTTHFRQVAKSYTHSVTISLGGGIVRNNLNVVLEAERSEAHLYGLYFLQGATHTDNHTLVDHAAPNCDSNELYKGVMDDQTTAVFNGKVLVRQPAQKTNAYQSNKNVLLSGTATVNSKPQLEIFADDVKCSHGCTVGRLDEEGLFYLRSRGIPEDEARSMLVQAFALDVLEQIKPEPIRRYVEGLLADRLTLAHGFNRGKV